MTNDTSQINCGPAVSRVGGVRSGASEWCTLCVRYGSSATCHVWRTPIRHAIRVLLLLASLLCSSSKRLRSRHAELPQLWRRICVLVSSSFCKPPFLDLSLSLSLLCVFLSVALSSISLVICWNREAFAGSFRTVSLLCRIAAWIDFNHLTPNDHYSGRTAPLTSKRCILYIYSTNKGTEYFKHGIYSSFFFLFKMQFVS